MKRADYFIVLFEGDWHIKFNGKHFGPLRTEREAAEIATTAAKRALAHGVPSTVYAQDCGGRFRQTWPSSLSDTVMRLSSETNGTPAAPDAA